MLWANDFLRNRPPAPKKIWWCFFSKEKHTKPSRIGNSWIGEFTLPRSLTVLSTEKWPFQKGHFILQALVFQGLRSLLVSERVLRVKIWKTVSSQKTQYLRPTALTVPKMERQNGFVWWIPEFKKDFKRKQQTLGTQWMVYFSHMNGCYVYGKLVGKIFVYMEHVWNMKTLPEFWELMIHWKGINFSFQRKGLCSNHHFSVK